MTGIPDRTFAVSRRFLAQTRGAAAAEFAIWAVAILVPLLGATDIAFYAYRRMQVEIGAQAAAAAAWKTCDTAAKLPAAKNCTGLLTAMTAAAQSTSIGANVTIPAGGVIDGYYCVDNANTLVQVGTTAGIGGTPTSPGVCPAGSVTTVPGEYLKVTTTYTNTNLFSAISVSSLLPTPITQTAWMRLN